MNTKLEGSRVSFGSSLVFAILVLVGINLVFPLLVFLFTQNKQYAAFLFATHVLPLFVQKMDRPFGVETVLGFCASLFFAAILLAVLDRFVATKTTRPVIRSASILFCYAILLLGIWVIAIRK